MNVNNNNEMHQAAREASPWLVWYGRFGFAVKGIVYLLIAVLAVQTALGAGGETAGSAGAIERVGRAPFGRYLLLAMGAGIVGYALWRLLQALMDTENKGTNAKGLGVRFGYLLIALAHAGLAFSTFSLVTGGKESQGDSTPGWTAQLMAQPFGRVLVAAVGAMVVAYALAQFRRSYTAKFLKKLLLSEMSATEQTWACRIGRLGYAARGVVFSIVGAFLILAALHSNPREARGLDGALATLAEQQWGWLVLSVVALGLGAYGLYMFVQARYRRMVIT